MLNICIPIITGSHKNTISSPAKINLVFLFILIILNIWSNCSNSSITVIITTSIGKNIPYPIGMVEMKLNFLMIILPG